MRVPASIADTNGNIVGSVDFNVRGGTPTPTPQPTNPTLTLSSSALTGTAGSNVPLAATARDATGNTVPGIGVTFTLSTTNSGAVSPSVAITNANGVAQTTVTLPNTNAQVTVTATVGGTSLTQTASVTVPGATETADTGTAGQTAAVAESLSISGPSSFTGDPNVRLSEPLAVRILDTNGHGSSGETVFFTIVERRGRLSP